MTELIYKNMNDMTTCFNYCNNKSTLDLVLNKIVSIVKTKLE